jgi:hypothetical protein
MNYRFQKGEKLYVNMDNGEVLAKNNYSFSHIFFEISWKTSEFFLKNTLALAYNFKKIFQIQQHSVEKFHNFSRLFYIFFHFQFSIK